MRKIILIDVLKCKHSLHNRLLVLNILYLTQSVKLVIEFKQLYHLTIKSLRGNPSRVIWGGGVFYWLNIYFTTL